MFDPNHKVVQFRRQPKRKTLKIVFAIGADTYLVIPLYAHPEIATAAFQMRKKVPEGEAPVSYDVRQLPEGGCECECMGWLRWGKCKHVDALKAAGMLF